MAPASTPGRRRIVTWAVVLFGTTACGASEVGSSAPEPIGSGDRGRSTVVDRSGPTPTAAGTTDAAPVPTAAAPSPLAGLVADIGSAAYDPSEHDRPPAPVGISIPDLRIESAFVIPVGVDDKGDLDVPDPGVVGWYEHGPVPGEPGSTVLAAHVNFNGDPGVFRYLRDLEPGATVTVTSSDGSQHAYVVTEVRLVDKDDLSEIGVWRRDGEPTLTLITCGGRFDDDRRRYEDNVIAVAAPV